MGLFDFLLKKRSYAVADPEQLRERLFDAVAAGQRDELRELCRANLDAIQQHFKSWTKAVTIRSDPAQVQRYGEGLTSILRCIDADLQRADLIPTMVDTSESNPLVKWQRRFEEARNLTGDGRLGEAALILSDVLIDVGQFIDSKSQSKGAEQLLAATYGLLGQCQFHTGRADHSLPALTQALKLCEQVGDQEGIGIYLLNLYEVHRYRGDANAAAPFADRLSAFHQKAGPAGLARRYAKLAEIVRNGEPLTRIVFRIGAEVWEAGELKKFPEGKIQFEFARNRLELMPAARMNEDGCKLGAAGKYDEALDCFRAAAKADKFAPQARYEAAATLALLRRYPQAVESMAEVEPLAPGWFDSRADLWLMEQISAGLLPHEIFLGIRILADGSMPQKEKLEIAEGLLQAEPAVGRLHLEYGRILLSVDRDADAAAAFRRGLECVQDVDVKSRLLLSLALNSQDTQEKKQLLNRVIETDGNLNATATARILLKN
jgi:tetratricopeptide (TPR) repeat protein